jgi:O-succinylbenzoic acid--CoA ligase
VTDRLLLADGTTQVLDALGQRLAGAGAGAVAPLPTDPNERARTLAMLRPELPVEEAGAAAVVATSGSTGRPRGVVLTAAALVASAEATHRRLGGPGRWVLALPTHYVAGLMVLVRSLVADRSVVEVDGRLDALAALAFPDDGPTYLSVVPTQLTRALTDPAKTAALRRCDAVLLGGAAADPALLARAQQAGVAVVTTYGMSETCGGCVYDGLPLDGVDVSADDGGRLAIGGPTVFAGYRLDPAATADALVGGRLVTRDRGRVAPDGRIEVLGRVDDVVISGGLNVDLAAVERALRGWAGDGAAVVGVPHPDWGVEVVAVVARDERPAAPSVPPDHRPPSVTGERGSLADLRVALAADLPAYALPRRLVVRADLPRTSGGKIDRRQLIADLTELPVDHPEDRP